MKNATAFLLFVLCISPSFGQSHSDVAGMWKIIVAASGLKAGHTIPTYLVLNNDSSYVWGIDSTAADPMKGVSRGTWALTDDGAIKFTPVDTTGTISYYSPVGNGKYKYRSTEKNGKKIPVHMLEMDFFIMRLASGVDE